MGGAAIVAATTGAHEVGGGVDGVMTDTTTRSFSIVGGDGFFDCFIPIRIVSHERSGGGFYLLERFVELRREPTGWTVEAAEDFVVVTGGEVKIAVDVVSGSCIDVAVVHTEMRVRVGEQE